MVETTEPREPIRIAIARWIGKSGYWRHVTDPDRQWERCQVEADGLLADLRENGYVLIATSRDSEVALRLADDLAEKVVKWSSGSTVEHAAHAYIRRRAEDSK